MRRGSYFTLALFWVVLWGALEREAVAKAKWMPSQRQFAALDRASDCSVYQSIKNRFQESLSELKLEIEQENNDLKSFYGDLERCAKSNHLAINTDDEEREAELAIACESEYQNWIQRSYRVLMLEDERGLTRSKRDEANRQLGQCPGPSARQEMVNKASLGDLF